MNNRIIRKFNELKTEDRGGFIPFIVAGDPDLDTTKKLILELGKQDAGVIELGIPFSDPVADGVTIQASAERALRNSISVGKILDVVGEVRNEGCETPIILFSYFNPILQFGLKNFAETAKKAGADGILITDLIPEEAAEFHEILTANELCLIMLAAPTSSDERLEKICKKASGFVYAVSRAGVTGARNEMSSEAENLVERLRKFTDLPIAVGFGISNAEQVAETWKYADAAVVGSAIVKEMMNLTPNLNEVPKDFVQKIGEFAGNLLPYKSKPPSYVGGKS
ncbi:MAG: tryptophan synthase subunit alpha [Pyrinomonadaceae bacterium]|nr:tryptophan synthase subunit alpha [Pyrinomonadaceae bacterium]